MLLLVSLSKVELLLINAHFSYMYVCCKWNVLPPELRTNHISLASFKCLLLQYHGTMRVYICTTLMTSEPGEQSVPGQRCNIVRSLLHLH